MIASAANYREYMVNTERFSGLTTAASVAVTLIDGLAERFGEGPASTPANGRRPHLDIGLMNVIDVAPEQFPNDILPVGLARQALD